MRSFAWRAAAKLIVLVEPSSVRWPSFSEARLNRPPAKWIFCAIVEVADLRAAVSILSNDKCRTRWRIGLKRLNSVLYRLSGSWKPSVRHVAATRGAAPFAYEQLGGRSVVEIGHGRIPLGHQHGTFALELKTLDNI